MRQPSFPFFGTAYYPDAWPEAEWRRDLELIKASGITVVRWGEFSWSWWERRPGEFDFAATDRFVALCGEVGLELILCTPTATPPSWLIHRHPDMLLVDQFGRPHVGPRHYGCYNHPGYRDLVERLVTNLASRYRDNAAVVGWQIDNEPTIGECNAGNAYDYNPHTLAAWRVWLRETYGTLDELNRRWLTNFWSRTYSDWDEIDAPRPKHGHINPSAWLAWCQFRSLNLNQWVWWQRDLLRRVCPGVSVGTNIPECGPAMAIELGQDYWGQARGLDWAGTDLYVFQRHPQRERRLLAYHCDIMRSAVTQEGGRFVIMESQAGPHLAPWRVPFMGGDWSPEFLRASGELYRHHGAEAVCWFLWRPWRTGHEMGMNALVDADGAPSERSRALPGILASTTPAPRPSRATALIHYSYPSLYLGKLSDPDLVQATTLPGWHTLLHETGRDIAFADDAQLAKRAFALGDLLVMPYTTVVDAVVTAAVQRCLAAGGTVIAGPATGFFDADGQLQAPRPAGLDAVFGLRIRNCDYLAEVQLVQQNLDPVAKAVQSGQTVDSGWRLGGSAIAGLVALCEPTTAEVVVRADGGQPILLRQRHGGGSAIFVACDPGTLLRQEAAVALALVGHLAKLLP